MDFPIKKRWFSIAMLVHQRVLIIGTMMINDFQTQMRLHLSHLLLVLRSEDWRHEFFSFISLNSADHPFQAAELQALGFGSDLAKDMKGLNPTRTEPSLTDNCKLTTARRYWASPTSVQEPWSSFKIIISAGAFLKVEVPINSNKERKT